MKIIRKKHMLSTVLTVVLSLCIVLICAACGSTEPGRLLDLQALYDSLLQDTDTPEMFLLSSERVNKLYNIDISACLQAVFATCADGLRIDEIWLVEAATEEDAKDIETIAQGRVEQLMHETEYYLPDQFAVAKQAEILRVGRTVALFISPEASEMVSIFNKA